MGLKTEKEFIIKNNFIASKISFKVNNYQVEVQWNRKIIVSAHVDFPKQPQRNFGQVEESYESESEDESEPIRNLTTATESNSRANIRPQVTIRETIEPTDTVLISHK